MEHSDVIEKEIIEGYILHRLNEEEINDFEEHLLYCSECRRQLAETKKNLALIQYMALHTASQESPRIKASATCGRHGGSFRRRFSALSEMGRCASEKNGGAGFPRRKTPGQIFMWVNL